MCSPPWASSTLFIRQVLQVGWNLTFLQRPAPSAGQECAPQVPMCCTCNIEKDLFLCSIHFLHSFVITFSRRITSVCWLMVHCLTFPDIKPVTMSWLKKASHMGSIFFGSTQTVTMCWANGHSRQYHLPVITLLCTCHAVLSVLISITHFWRVHLYIHICVYIYCPGTFCAYVWADVLRVNMMHISTFHIIHSSLILTLEATLSISTDTPHSPVMV